eukprot:CAMPEP_0115711678 /NCGR_PEP_ID=MMETSP0272-20121206/73699_1 /TAXON_ID=71861 /ORGANISM="Scrippsiella trochoidea, Strain CCMP3099" /LENGTH=45 /DNA_ID= /DNA_START= /DNA_END= /DNA_ORIENTATION=
MPLNFGAITPQNPTTKNAPWNETSRDKPNANAIVVVDVVDVLVVD